MYSALLRLSIAAVVAVTAIVGPVRAARVIIGSYYDDTLDDSCSGSINCAVLFTAVPAGKKVIITRLACQLRATASVTLLQVRFAVAHPTAGILQEQFVDFRQVSASSLQKFYIVDTNPFLLVRQNTRPQVHMVTNSNSQNNLDCHIAGTIADF